MSKAIEKVSDEQVAKLNEKTGWTPPSVTPIIKFNAKEEEGKWYITTGQLDGESGSSEYKELGSDEITVHIIAANRKQIQSSMVAKVKVSSDEVSFFDSVVSLKDVEGNVVATGPYKELKQKHPDYNLKFSRIIYVIYDNKPYKMYLSGNKSFAFSEYNNLGNPALVETKIKKSELIPTDFGSKVWTIKFEKGDKVPMDVINTRVDEVNDYLKQFNDSLLASAPKEAKQIEEPTYVKDPEAPVDIEEVPFE